MSEVLDDLGLLPALIDRSYPGAVGTALLLGLAVLLWGLAATVIRFAGLRTYLTDDGFVLRYGLLSLRDRRVSHQAVIGAELRRTLIEAALGRVRLTLLTRDSSAGLGTNLVLPSLPEDVVRRIILGPLGERVAVAQVWDATSRPRVVRLMAVAAAVVLVVPTLLGLVLFGLGLPLAAAAVVALVLLPVTASVGRAVGATVRVERAGAVVTLRTCFVDERCSSVWTSAVEARSSWTLLGRLTVSRVQVYAGGVRSIVAYARPQSPDKNTGRRLFPDPDMTDAPPAPEEVVT